MTTTRQEQMDDERSPLAIAMIHARSAYNGAREAHKKEVAGNLEPLDEEWAEYPPSERPAHTSAEHLLECIEYLEKALKEAHLGFTDGPWPCTRVFEHRHWEDGGIYTTQCRAPATNIEHEDGSTGWRCENGCQHWHYGSKQGEQQMIEDERRWRDEGYGY